MFYAEAAAPPRILGPAPGLGRSRRILDGADPAIHRLAGTILPADGEGFHGLSGAGRATLAFHLPFFAGEAQRLRLALRPPTGCRVTIEALVPSRMSKARLVLDAAGQVLEAGDELPEPPLTTPLPGGGFALAADFLPFHSRADFLLMHLDAPAEATLRWSDLRWDSHAVEAIVPSRGHLPLIEEGGTYSATQSWSLFRDYLQLEFEVIRPGACLTGLALESPLPLEHASWWTSDAVVEGTAPDGPGLLPLAPRRPRIHRPSPATMDLFGPEHGFRGHRIRAVLADTLDLSYLSVAESDAVTDLRLHLRFDDGGTSVVTPHASVEHFKTAIMERVADHFVAQALEEGGPGQVFLELGARGPASALLRSRLDPRWRYVGTDIEGDPNISVVADAHRLSEALPHGSVAVCYSNSVLEHLFSPEKVVLEVNALLRTGGLFIAIAPFAWPLHAEPWDYQRFTMHKWPALLNAETGYEILYRFETMDHALVPLLPFMSGITRGQHVRTPAMTGVVARRTGPARAVWTGWRPGLAQGRYDP